MSTAWTPITYRGRSFGILVLVAAQLLVGFIHVGFGFWLLLAQGTVGFFGSAVSAGIYSTYTIAFSLCTLIFAVGIWLQKSLGLDRHRRSRRVHNRG
ncbi:MAG: hypothetical protein NWF00_11475 [Candidatus Bathyarchaeota archaeon]|nr:hypothetical protein [Candidatus Bathyarchaeota archaeon]